MISFTRVETKEIDEEVMFEELIDCLFEQEAVSRFHDSVDVVKDLPENIQRLVFAKMGAMLIDYAKNGDF